MWRLSIPVPRRAGSVHVAGLLAAVLVLLVLSACASLGVARTKETTYVMGGKTYVLQEFRFKGVHNFTLFEVVDGERSFTALYDPGEGPSTDVFKDPIPEDEGHLTTIMTVAQNGEQQGETVVTDQRSWDPTRVLDGD
ncbi:MAG: hypothetical protein ACE5EU_06035 [Paracoccaceae bacterium]